MESPQDALNKALALHSQGQLDEAINLYEQILRSRPGDQSVVANLASALVRAGRTDEGLSLYEELTNQAGRQPEVWFNYANALQRAGNLTKARQTFERTLEVAPKFFPAALNLANLIRDAGDSEEAVTRYRRAIAMKPEHPKPRVNLARLLRSQKRFNETREVLDDGLKSDSLSVELLYERALLGYETGETDVALQAVEQLLKIQPTYGIAYTLIGLVEYERGNVQSAVQWWNRLAKLEPNNPEPHINLGTLRQKERRHEQAVGHFREAVSRAPNDLGANLKLGLILSTTGHVSEAKQIGLRLTEMRPDRSEGFSLLANGLHEQGLCEESRTAFDEALAKQSDDSTLIGNALFSSLYSDTLSDDEILSIHSQLSTRLHQLATEHDEPTPCPVRVRSADSRIRVGYLSPDLLKHPVGYFVEPILERHDRNKFEVFCYSDNGSCDELTKRLQVFDLTWHECATWSDRRLEEQIRSDRLDILIDLSGHTAKNRAMVLSRKPAPIQATYLGYPGKTERPANDWLIADYHVCPTDQQVGSHERITRLANCFLCYQSQPDTPDVAPPPFQKNGFITFGSFNHLAKLTDSTVHLWSRVLNSVPDSKLVLKALPLADEGTRRLAQQRFVDCGIDPKRIEPLPPTVPLSAFLAEYSRMDIALDTVPYNGGTTSCDALWMGVPVVTLPGGRFSSRMGASVLKTVGLEELVANDADDYVRLAASLASDTRNLQDFRSTLRNQVSVSPLCNAAEFSRDFETVLQEIVAESTAGSDAPN
jgi:predicted O-linked N-acetylglucosamine transferase (SPINDLY family)